jgi:nitrogen regulatory protein P-II 1
MEEKIVAAVIKASKTGTIGDGKVFVYSIDKSYRIRTEEEGEASV